MARVQRPAPDSLGLKYRSYRVRGGRSVGILPVVGGDDFPEKQYSSLIASDR